MYSFKNKVWLHSHHPQDQNLYSHLHSRKTKTNKKTNLVSCGSHILHILENIPINIIALYFRIKYLVLDYNQI